MTIYPLIGQAIIAALLFGMILGLISYLILLERKTAAWIQDRVGPNRTGPKGLMQPLADGVKFLLKEDFFPSNAEKVLYYLAPIAIFAPAACGFAVIPWGGTLAAGTNIFGFHFAHNFPIMVANPNIGVLFVIAAAGLAVYGIVLGGWASGSKFSFLGGLRATAQMLSYEVPMALSIMAIVVIVGSLKLPDIIAHQARYGLGGILPYWNIFLHPIAFLIFTTAIFAECNRLPFDLPECETELVAGYHTEYSSMKFALFYLAEYASMITGAAVLVALFLGGWHLPWLDKVIYGGNQPEATGWGGVALKFVVFWGKVVAFLFIYMWVRWTLPRFRFDQLMNLAWRGMIPLALGSFLIAVVVKYMVLVGVVVHEGYWLTGLNVLFGALTLFVVGRMPVQKLNKRASLPFSRYNPELVRTTAVEV